MKKKIVIVGGGFAGSIIAKSLEKRFDVFLVDMKNYFEFTPGVLRSVVEPEHIKRIQVLHKHYLRKAKVIIGKVREISKDFVIVNSRKIKFNYLAICSGSSYNAPFKEQNIIMTSRTKNLLNSYNKLRKAKKVLIIGGGLVGVEMAGEILYKYKNEKEVTIIHSQEKLIQRNQEMTIKQAENFLRKRNVEIIYNDEVIKIKGKKCETKNGLNIEADIIFLCTGIMPNYDFMKKNFSNYLTEDNFVKVNNYLQLEGEKNIFAAGDLTNIKEEKTAQNAERQGEIIIKNILALEEKKDLFKYHNRRTPLVISLGKYSGIYSGKGIVFSGLIPAFMKTIIERWEMFKKRQYSRPIKSFGGLIAPRIVNQ